MGVRKQELEVSGEGGERLDVFLARRFHRDYSRTRVKHLIAAGAVLVNGRPVKPHYEVRVGDRIQVELREEEPLDFREEAIPLAVVHEDEHLLVVDKSAGMVVHPAYGHLEHTLVNALLYHTRQELSQVGGPVRPGIVHRLDKDTSGLIVVAKHDRAHRILAKQFKNHTVERVYQALVKGVVQHEEMKCAEPVGRAFFNRKKVIVKPSGGKEACTYFRVLARMKTASLVEARPRTGRTHQVRVHLAYLGHPVLGDPLYGGASPLIRRQALHASVLAFDHPATGKRVRFTSDLAADMRELLMELRG